MSEFIVVLIKYMRVAMARLEGNARAASNFEQLYATQALVTDQETRATRRDH